MKDHILLNNEVNIDETASKGVGFLVQQKHSNSIAIIELKPILSRLDMIRLKAERNNLTFIHMYAPTSAHESTEQKNKNENEMDSFSDDLQNLFNKTAN